MKFLALAATAAAVRVTPDTNVPANPALTAGAMPDGTRPRWGTRYPAIPAPVLPPVNTAQPSTNGSLAGPLTATNGDSQSFFARQSLAEVTPDHNVPQNPALTAGAMPDGTRPRWGTRYPAIPAPVLPPINWAQPSTNGATAGPLTATNGDSQSFIARQSLAEVTPDHNVPSNPALTAGAMPDGTRPRWGTRYPAIPAPVLPPVNTAKPSTNGSVAGPLTATNGDSQSFLARQALFEVTPAHNVPANPDLTAGAPADGTKPRWGTRYSLDQKTPDHPVFPVEWTAGASNDTQPRFGSPYYRSLADVTPDHPVFPVDSTAGASKEAQPRFGSPYYRN